MFKISATFFITNLMYYYHTQLPKIALPHYGRYALSIMNHLMTSPNDQALQQLVTWIQRYSELIRKEKKSEQQVYRDVVGYSQSKSKESAGTTNVPQKITASKLPYPKKHAFPCCGRHLPRYFATIATLEKQKRSADTLKPLVALLRRCHQEESRETRLIQHIEEMTGKKEVISPEIMAACPPQKGAFPSPKKTFFRKKRNPRQFRKHW